jgi:Domain of unknown function (DUF4129)
MTRAWDEFVADLFDVVPPGTVLLILILASLAAGALWYFFPAWVPRRLPRIRLPRWKRRIRRPKRKRAGKPAAEPVITLPEQDEPAAPEPVGTLSLADRLAAEGRYAEAIRQRLRDTLRELVNRRLIPPQPGWTAAELSTMAAEQRPAVAWPLGNATELFSEVWYGDRPAGRDHDEHMRTLTDQVRAAL